MRSSYNKPELLIRKITLVTLLFTVCIGAVSVLFQIKPFWVDEWFILYNLKTKDAAGLFGHLDLLQQFPRVYLEILKSFTSFFNYSYFSLRLPSYLVSVSTVILSYKMMKKIFDHQVFARYLFVLILVSSFTFTEYFVQIKQYSMDILLSVFALWQLSELLKLKDHPVKLNRYIFLCFSFLMVPFFSYTYPIAIAPAYVVTLLQTIALLKSNSRLAFKWKITILQWAPLLICTFSIAIFYIVDANQLIADKSMYNFWNFLFINNDNKLLSFLTGFYALFSQLGAGVVFESLFGILGVVSFIYAIVSCVKNYTRKQYSLEAQLIIYSCLLIVLCLSLFLFKKLPLGTPRLNAFTMPSIAILIIYFINQLSIYIRSDLQKMALPVILYIGVIGNVYSRYINYFTSPVYKKQMKIYVSTGNAIQLAEAKKIPILITLGITYPYERAVVDAGAPDPGAWVLKSFPAYHMNEHLPVYAIKDLDNASEFIRQLPANINTILVGDGTTFHIVNRNGTL